MAHVICISIFKKYITFIHNRKQSGRIVSWLSALLNLKSRCWIQFDAWQTLNRCRKTKCRIAIFPSDILKQIIQIASVAEVKLVSRIRWKLNVLCSIRENVYEKYSCKLAHQSIESIYRNSGQWMEATHTHTHTPAMPIETCGSKEKQQRNRRYVKQPKYKMFAYETERNYFNEFTLIDWLMRWRKKKQNIPHSATVISK